MSKEAWFRPQNDVVGFIPATPGGGLAAGIQQIVREEGKKIGVNIKIAEQSGTALSALLTSPDLSGCLFPRCTISEDGGSHSRRGSRALVLFVAVCTGASRASGPIHVYVNTEKTSVATPTLTACPNI